MPQNILLRKTIMTIALALPMVSLIAQSALADKYNFRVYNQSRNNIVSLFMTSSDSDRWGSDILGSGILRSGYNIPIYFNDMSYTRCLYDIRAIFDNGEVVEDHRINVCNSEREIFYDN
ncbi:MAG: hypothetical protein AB4426_28905 [Xenococcaceae cyanobacterium]